MIVYGGENTAIDVAKTAKRLVKSDTFLIYRRTRKTMRAHDFEVQEAVEEGVRMPLEASGFPQPTGAVERIAADSMILASGQDAELGSFSETSKVLSSAKVSSK